jgi:hypothetical protein
MQMSSFKNDDYDRRLRLISLAYEGLRDMKLPDGATEVEALSLLSREFSDKATLQETLEAPARKSPSMYSPAYGRR